MRSVTQILPQAKWEYIDWVRLKPGLPADPTIRLEFARVQYRALLQLLNSTSNFDSIAVLVDPKSSSDLWWLEIETGVRFTFTVQYSPRWKLFAPRQRTITILSFESLSPKVP